MARPSPSALPVLPVERRYGYRFNRIAYALSQHTLLNARRQFGLNLAEFRTLSVLSQSNALSIREIAESARLDKAHATRAVNDLISRGLVTRVVDRHDRRLREVRLTRAGHGMATASVPFLIERQIRLERRLTAAELRVFDKALALMAEEAERMLAEEIQKVPERP